MRFAKLEGLGNDYLYINCLEGEPPGLPGLAKKLSDRHFGPGADGLICVKPGRTGDFSMEMYNADGSLGAMCGNGLRCFGKYVYETGLTRKACLTVDTGAGPRKLELRVRRGRVEEVSVDMGPASVGRAVRLEAGGAAFEAVPVSVGNPHAVIFCGDPAAEELERLGPLLEVHPALGVRSNIEFAAAPDPETLSVRVWERGSGVTLACGTGACAVFAAARSRGLCGDRASVRLPGGTLALEQQGGAIRMTGPARWVYTGETAEEWDENGA